MSVKDVALRILREAADRRELAKEKKRRSVVRVVYRDLDRDYAPSGAHDEGYAFDWTLGPLPEIGMRVQIPGGDGKKKSGIIVGFGRAGYAGDLEKVIKIHSASEIEKAQAKAAKEAAAWLDMARRAAGLPTPGRARLTTPGDYPAIAPADGKASARKADEYGRMWWRAMKLSEELGREAAETRAFSGIAHRWFAIRDQGK
ncbi:hypothetical protein [Microbacterium indicum]|uniref:hypothetical protein n=1 Tax=Microbacterium indicum TaxID=358100 RepID=UPI000491A960|nr:hypothetical protein [Microbacterium indicum]